MEEITKKGIIKARFSGFFYEKTKEKLQKQISSCIKHRLGPKKKNLGLNAKTIIVPHAGYSYSGPLMAYAYSSLQNSDRIFIFATNHSGKGDGDLILMSSKIKAIEIPLGKIGIDSEMNEKLKSELSIYVEENDEILINEHSYEVQLPFIKYFFPNAKIIPIIVNTFEIDKIKYFAEKVLEISKARGNSSFVFTSDFTHYGIAYGFMPYEFKGKKLKQEIYLFDKQCIDKIMALDTLGFEKEARKTTICGIAPIMLCIELAKLEGLYPLFLNYYTSSDITHDYDYISHAIVGYAGIAFRKKYEKQNKQNK